MTIHYDLDPKAINWNSICKQIKKLSLGKENNIKRMTIYPQDVTCKNCKKSQKYKKDLLDFELKFERHERSWEKHHLGDV